MIAGQRGRGPALLEPPVLAPTELDHPEVHGLGVQLQQQGERHADAHGGGDREEERGGERGDDRDPRGEPRAQDGGHLAEPQ